MRPVHETAFLSAVLLALVACLHARAHGAEGKMTAMPDDLHTSYGFRHDPMKFVESGRSLQGALERTQPNATEQ